MTPLEHKIRARIRRDGPIGIGAYMAAVLGDAEHGYYRRRDRFGVEGDFTTAPEISQVFGELIGLWCAVTWRQMESPAPVRLVELGPGRGTLMADALRAARVVPAFIDAVDLHLVETSELLRGRQRQALADAPVRRLRWHGRFDRVPRGPMLLLANEFFDALPIEQYVRTRSGWRRVSVGLDGESGGLRFVRDGAVADADIPPSIRDAPPGSVCEAGPQREALVHDIGARLARDGGAALIVDYGPARSAAGDTLQAVRRHRYCDVLADPGEVDVTAHVDFEALGGAAAAAGARVHGPLPQGLFLDRLGLRTRARRLAAENPARAGDIRSGCRRLSDPARMGVLFKALALTHPGLPAPAGFEETPGDARAAEEGPC